MKNSSRWQRPGQNNSRKKRKALFFLFLGVCALGFLFRHSLFVVGTECFLKIAFSKNLKYEKASWENGCVAISGLHLEEPSYSCSIDRMEISLASQFFPLYFEPHLFLIHPQITLKNNKEASAPAAFGFLVPTETFGLKLDMQNGVLELDGAQKKERLYFLYKKGEGKEKIGSLLLSFDPSLFDQPLASIDLGMKEDLLCIESKVQEVECSKLFPFASFFYPKLQEGWKEIEGDIEIDSKLSFSVPLKLEQMAGKLQMRNLSLANTTLGLEARAESFHGEVLYPSTPEYQRRGAFWDGIIANSSLEGGEVLLSDPLVPGVVGLTNIEATLALNPEEDPLFDLRGLLVHEGQSSNVHIEGKGSINEDKSFWTQMEFVIAAKEKSSALISLCSQEEDAFVLEADFKNIVSDQIRTLHHMFSHTHPVLSRFEIIEGAIEGKVTAWGSLSKIKKIHLENFIARNMGYSYLPLNSVIYFEKLQAEASLESEKEKEWIVGNLHADLKKGGFQVANNGKEYNGEEIQMHLSLQDNQLLPSWIEGDFEGIHGKVRYLGKEEEREISVELTSSLENAYKWLPIEKKEGAAPPFAVSISSSIKPEKDSFNVLGALTFSKEKEPEQKIDFGFDVRNFAFSSESKKPFELDSGWFRTERLSSEIYAPLLFALDLRIKGDLDFFGDFDKEKVELSLQGNDLNIDHPLFSLQIPSLGIKDPLLLNKEGRGLFSYDVQGGLWKGKIPLQNATAQEKKNDLTFENIQGEVKIDGSQLQIDDLAVLCAGIECKGALHLHLLENNAYELKVASKKIHGNLDSLSTYFPFLSSLTGELSSRENGLLFLSMTSSEGTRTECKFQGQLRKVQFPINKTSSLKDLAGDIDYDSENQRLHIYNTSGDLICNEKSYLVKLNHLHIKNCPKFESGFDIQLSDQGKELARIVGLGEERGPSEIHFTLQKSPSHFFGAKLDLTNFVIKDKKMSQAQVKAKINCQEMLPMLNFLHKGSFLALEESALEFVQERNLQGTIETSLSYEEPSKKFTFSAEGKDLKENGNPLRIFLLQGQRSQGQWLIEKLQIDQIQLKISLYPNKDRWIVPSFEIASDWGKAKGEASFSTIEKKGSASIKKAEVDLSKFGQMIPNFPLKGDASLTGNASFSFPSKNEWSAKGDMGLALKVLFPVQLSSQNEKTIKWEAGRSGIAFHGLKLRIQEKNTGDAATLEAPAIIYDFENQRGEIQKASCVLSPQLLAGLAEKEVVPFFFKNLRKEPLKIAFESEFGKTFSIKSQIGSGTFWIGERPWEIDQIWMNYSPSSLVLGGRTELNQTHVFFGVKLDLGPDLLGMVKLQENPKKEGINILFSSSKKQGVKWENVQGSMLGLDVNLKKDPLKYNVLSGSIKIDASRLMTVFPKEIKEKIAKSKVGKGYWLEGSLSYANDLQFSGNFKGRDFELFGYKFEEFLAQTEISSHSILMKNAVLQDDAGEISIKQVKIVKEKEDWKLDAPLIQAKNVRPSLLKKVAGGSSPAKPLIVKNITLQGLSGILGNLGSFAADGTLFFTNSHKKEFNLLDVPLEMLKDLGLDPGLLTPVSGDVDFELFDGKWQVKEFKNMYSEGKRSQFYLHPEDSSYMDMDGNLHVNIRMKQEATLKIAEPFTFLVRGTLEKPRYFVK